MATTAKQRRFIAEYAKDTNATAAAKRAGYSAKTAGQAGARLLKNVNIKRAIEGGQARRAATAGVTADYIVDCLKKIIERSMSARRHDARGAVMAIEVLIRNLDPFRGDRPTGEPQQNIDLSWATSDDLRVLLAIYEKRPSR